MPKRKFAELKPVPSIFQDIIDGKRGSGHRSVVPSSGSAPVISEEDVLQGALAFKPPQANGKKPSKPGCGKKKKGKAAKKKPSQPKNPGPAKPAQSKKQKQKNKKEKDAQKAQGCGLEVPPGVSSFKFQSSRYGQCKLEMYTEKSYIRYLDPSSKKWKSIIGSSVIGHHQKLCRLLVPHVASGLNVASLLELRGKLLEQLVDVD